LTVSVERGCGFNETVEVIMKTSLIAAMILTTAAISAPVFAQTSFSVAMPVTAQQKSRAQVKGELAAALPVGARVSELAYPKGMGTVSQSSGSGSYAPSTVN
jgi:hypothetical protein